eukprot:CAMPEP_0197428094 /NCGR_PEP_ID=MMETSP1170-20131217/40110_1 /TAXON_ID=54406 /ORGANISM="Sarcinochrysis sp, Strain CCMP770" /LENGTH=82 /DNA_ID=CAMNT_0042955815 /DNA_START=24 /DNA_END=272 /DNA_ORIENTATION=+
MIGRLLAIPDIAVNVVRGQDWGFFALKLAPWALPGAMFAGWMVFPALTDSFKQSIGLEKAPPSGQTYEYEKGDVGEVPELKS